jgi:hypothetical protein
MLTYLDTLCSALGQRQKELARRYLQNALDGKRCSIRAANAHLQTLCSDAAGKGLLEESGFVLSTSSEEPQYVVEPEASAERLKAALASLNRADRDDGAACSSSSVPSLFSLPDELVLRLLYRMPPRELCAVGLSCTAGRSIASAGCLWLRHCAPRFWAECVGSDRLGLEDWLALAPIGVASDAMALRTAPMQSLSSQCAGCRRRGVGLGGLVDWKCVYSERGGLLTLRIHTSSTPTHTLHLPE